MLTLLTLRQAAERLGLSPVTLRVQAERGTLRAKKIGPNWVVTPEECERYRSEHLRAK